MKWHCVLIILLYIYLIQLVSWHLHMTYSDVVSALMLILFFYTNLTCT